MPDGQIYFFRHQGSFHYSFTGNTGYKIDGEVFRCPDPFSSTLTTRILHSGKSVFSQSYRLRFFWLFSALFPYCAIRALSEAGIEHIVFLWALYARALWKKGGNNIHSNTRTLEPSVYLRVFNVLIEVLIIRGNFAGKNKKVNGEKL